MVSRSMISSLLSFSKSCDHANHKSAKNLNAAAVIAHIPQIQFPFMASTTVTKIALAVKAQNFQLFSFSALGAVAARPSS